MNIFDALGVDYLQEAEKTKKALLEAGVTEQQVAQAAVNNDRVRGVENTISSLLMPAGDPVQAPKTWKEKAKENYGTGGYLLRRLAQSIPLLTPTFVDEMIIPEMKDRGKFQEQQAAHEADKAKRAKAAEASRYLSALKNDDPTDDAAAWYGLGQMGVNSHTMQAMQKSEPISFGGGSGGNGGSELERVRALAAKHPEIYGDVLKAMEKDRLVPDAVTYTEGKMQWDPNYNNEDGSKGRYFLGRQGNDGSYKKDYQPAGFVPKSFLPSSEYIEKQIVNYGDEYLASEQRYDDIVSLEYQMDQIGKQAWGTGATGQAKETWKRFTGTEDPESMARKAYDRIRVTKAIGNLPPGVASDKDIELVLQPFPTSFTNYEQLREYLAGMRRAEEKIMSVNEFRHNYIKDNRTEAGLPEAWRNRWTELTSKGGKFYVSEEGEDALGLSPEERAAFEDWKKRQGL